jgi:hypothetical protein
LPKIQESFHASDDESEENAEPELFNYLCSITNSATRVSLENQNNRKSKNHKHNKAVSETSSSLKFKGEKFES